MDLLSFTNALRKMLGDAIISFKSDDETVFCMASFLGTVCRFWFYNFEFVTICNGKNVVVMADLTVPFIDADAPIYFLKKCGYITDDTKVVRKYSVRYDYIDWANDYPRSPELYKRYVDIYVSIKKRLKELAEKEVVSKSVYLS